MKILKYFLILIVAIIIWYLLYGFENSKPIVSIENGVSSETKGPLFKESKIPKAKKKTFDFTENPTVKIIEPVVDSQLTYLQAYRNTVFFKKCYGVINDINKNISPLIEFKKNTAIDFYDFTNESTKQASDLQLQYFSDFTQRCQSFLNDDKETHGSAKQRIYTIFSAMEPETEQEKNLASGLDLFNQRFDLEKSMNKTSSSYSLLDVVVLANIRQEIQNIYKSIKEYKANPDWRTNQQILDIIDDLNVRMSNLNLKIRNNRMTTTDNVTKEMIENQLIEHKSKIVKFLKQNDSPDIMLLYAPYIFYPARQDPDAIIIEMKHELHTYDIYLMLSLYDVGIKLAACAMNYPCDDQSEFILDYCIRGVAKLSNYPDACGKTLEDFYFNDYLSPNQFEDVSKYFNYILDHYAKH